MSVFNLSLDDQSPHPHAGLDFSSIHWCNKLVEKFPDIKINLFVPACYKRLGEQSYPLSKYPKWVKRMRRLPDNYSIGLHGYFHSRGNQSNNDELQFLHYEQMNTLLVQMDNMFRKAGLQYSKIIRPPGWKISKPACEFLSKSGFVIAGDEKHYNRYKNSIKINKWVSYNYDLNSPCVIKKGDVIAYGHTSNWTTNYFDEEKFNYIVDMLSDRKFTFKFLEEI